MLTQAQLDYKRIAKAIDYISANFKNQPSLEEVAAAVNLSSFHFQRLFSEWAGVSPKKFIQYISLQHAKALLKDQQSTLLNTAHETGLSGSGRLHDLFVNVERMTPGEFKNGGEALAINYCFAESPFGPVIVASTPKGVCHISFEDEQTEALAKLKASFPQASYNQIKDKFQQDALCIFQKNWLRLDEIKLHLNGTPFQLKVWESLLKIPMGRLTTYANVAKSTGNSKASRAVGSAIGKNPVAFLIPCHRVIQATGKIGGYKWDTTRKSAIIGWEASRAEA